MIGEFSKLFDLFCKVLESFKWPEYSCPIIWLKDKDEGGCIFLKINQQTNSKIIQAKVLAFTTQQMDKNVEKIHWIEYDRGEIHDVH